MDIGTKSDYVAIQHKLIGFYNRYIVCLLRGFYNRYSVFTARYELDLHVTSPCQFTVVFITDTLCVYCAVRAGSSRNISVPFYGGFYNRYSVCLLRGTSWIFT